MNAKLLRVTEVQPCQYALNDSSVTLALVPLSPRNRFISNLEESTNVSTRNTLSRKFSPILNIHREITHPLPARLPWLRAGNYIPRVADNCIRSEGDIKQRFIRMTRASRRVVLHARAICPHLRADVQPCTRSFARTYADAGEGSKAYVYVYMYIYVYARGVHCVSRSIFITCLERRRGGCSSETYESQRTGMQRTIVPAFQPANRNALSSGIWV